MPISEKTVDEIFSHLDRQDVYGKIGLKRNPFPANGNPPASPSIAPYPEVYERIKQFVVSFLRSKHSRGLVLLGDYGTGKTYHLKWIQSLLEARPLLNIRVVSVEDPGLEPYDLVRHILEQIGDQDIARAVWALVIPILKEEIRERGQAFFKKFAAGAVKGRRGSLVSLEDAGMDIPLVKIDDETLRDYREFLVAFDKSKALSREKLRDWGMELLYHTKEDHGLGITRNPGVARQIANLCFLSGKPALESWERLVIPDGKADFPAQGEPEFMQTIMRLLIATGVEYFVLLLDEFEKVPLMEQMTKREMMRYLDTIRMLADRGWQEESLPFAWVIASHDDAWSIIREEANRALAQRFPAEIQLPRSNDPKVARYLISQYLKLARITEEEGDSLSPFPEDLIDLILPALRRTPRNLLVFCYELLELAVNAEETVDGIIPTTLVQKLVERRQANAGQSGEVQ